MSIIETALRYDLDIEVMPYRVEVHLYDDALSETHTFSEDVDRRKDRRAALVRCVCLAAEKAKVIRKKEPNAEPY